MFDAVLNDGFDQDKLVLLYRNLFLESKKKENGLTNDNCLNKRIRNAIILVRCASYLFIKDPSKNIKKFIELLQNSQKLIFTIDSRSC